MRARTPTDELERVHACTDSHMHTHTTGTQTHADMLCTHTDVHNTQAHLCTPILGLRPSYRPPFPCLASAPLRRAAAPGRAGRTDMESRSLVPTRPRSEGRVTPAADRLRAKFSSTRFSLVPVLYSLHKPTGEAGGREGRRERGRENGKVRLLQSVTPSPRWPLWFSKVFLTVLRFRPPTSLGSRAPTSQKMKTRLADSMARVWWEPRSAFSEPPTPRSLGVPACS